ncbi:MAG: ABC transporter ATP-binding protein [Planctomycetota bacterium]
MRLRKEVFSRIGYRALRDTIGYVFPRVWSAGRAFALAMASAGILSAILTPVAVVILGMLAAGIKDFIEGKAGGPSDPILLMLLAVACAFVVVLCNAVLRYCRLRLGDELSWQVQGELLRHAATLDLGTLEDKKTQDILERASQEPGKKVLKFADGLLKVISSAVQVFGLAGVLFWIEPLWSSVLLLLGLPFLLSKSYLSLVNYQIQRNKTTSRRWSRYYAKRLTQRESVPSTKLLGLAPLMLDRHRGTMRGIVRANQRFFALQVVADMASAFVSLAAMSVVVILVARKAIAGDLGPAAFATFLLAAWKLRDSLSGLASSLSLVWDAQLTTANTREFMDLKPAFENRGTVRPTAIHGEIQLKNVSFTYPRNKHPVLRNLSLTIRAGETVAIVGHNGAGKTTLAKLMTRLYPVTEGEILIDGIPIHQFELEALHNRMSFVFQHPVRYEATAFENIAFGDWRKLLDSPEQVRWIAGAARVDKMIEQLPDGYDTPLGRMFGDHDLSGGQWQKLAIARALACDPSIVILDEPAANLDVNSEYALYQGIRELIRDRTTILISHRFSTVRMADRIFVLDEGRLVEQGSHDELLSRGGAYAAMCKIHEATFRMTAKTPLCNIPLPQTEIQVDQ